MLLSTNYFWGSRRSPDPLICPECGRHEHLRFGDGDMDFGPIVAALRQASYTGGAYVELPRHAHDAVEAARKAYDFLKKLSAPTG